MALYLRHRRANMTPSQKLFAAALLLLAIFEYALQRLSTSKI